MPTPSDLAAVMMGEAAAGSESGRCCFPSPINRTLPPSYARTSPGRLPKGLRVDMSLKTKGTNGTSVLQELPRRNI